MIDIQPVEIDGKFWINLSLDDHEMNRHGPYRDADEAEAAVRQLAGICAVFGQTTRVFEPTAREQQRS